MALFDVVFEGGGAKGTAFVGALRALKECGHGTRRLVGTSAGATIAMALAAGITADEMLKGFLERRDGKQAFARWLDPPRADSFTEAQRSASAFRHALDSVHLPGIAKNAILDGMLAAPGFPELFCLIECGGLYAGDSLIEWVKEELVSAGLAEGVTFGSLARERGVDLTLIASDTTDHEMLMLNHRTAPGVPVAWAVRMSMSIPLIWREVVWQKEWGPYLGRDKQDHTIVDGGLLSNFPMQLITGGNPAIMGDTDPAGALNIGFLLDETLPVPGMEAEAEPQPGGRQHRMKRRINNLVTTLFSARDRETMRAHKGEICHLPAKGCPTVDMEMNEDKARLLLESAYAATLQHLKQRGLG